MTTKKTTTKKKSQTRKKAAVLSAYDKSLGNVSETCKSVGISRETFYRWQREDNDFRSKVEETNEANIDFAEATLLRNIREGKETSLIFYLKTKGKKRGYIESVENNVTINPFLDLMKAATSEDEQE